ncbi:MULTISPECIES: hypothetical protein [Enterobacter cloacae complex]|uniref:hypothetical protein n=1 Tax=Enterobacter cloacae complex TaxID=354276 RepID=UPI0013082CF6|nr:MULTISPECIES: hypothetical protein [Enterobacter cloacae complex]EDG1208890.1 hypothetical protein [Salmonella enterica subsp. enterica serovar Newport]MDA4736866.1 hypothetical protein [Enterobacter kobei]MDA4743136.1 hypothetical protein [Enterobacter hormaechei]
MHIQPRTHLLTSCAKGKNHFTSTSPVLEIMPNASPKLVIEIWLNKLRNYPPERAVSVIDLYRGVHWSCAKEILKTTPNLDLWVISAGMGLLHSSERVIPYEATFNNLPFAPSSWWETLTEATQGVRRSCSIAQLMQTYPGDNYVISGSPVYVAAVERDIKAGIAALNNPVAQLTVITSGGYKGILEPYLVRSHAGMLNRLNANMVCLNIKLAKNIIQDRVKRSSCL